MGYYHFCVFEEHKCKSIHKNKIARAPKKTCSIIKRTRGKSIALLENMFFLMLNI